MKNRRDIKSEMAYFCIVQEFRLSNCQLLQNIFCNS